MPAGRPKENRKKMTVHVLPETADAINAAKNETLNTQGKVIDAMVATRERKKHAK